MELLKNKKVLFIAPKFYDYHTEMINYMKSQNAIVSFYPEDIYTSTYRISNKLLPFLSKRMREKYINTILDGVEENAYDIVLVIRGGILNSVVMTQLKGKLPYAKFVMYQWDSMRQSKYKSLTKYFDIVKTFDSVDAKKYNLQYLPLFYSQKYKDILEQKEEKFYDIVFYGSYHSERLEMIKTIDNYCSVNKLEFKYHLYITKLALARLILFGTIKIQELKYFKTYTVDSKEILDAYKKSFSVLDIELNIQNGLTIRTFEALGAGLKLITTNLNIRKEPFYNENNIIILDTHNINLDLDFFRKSFIVDKNFESYLFDNWFQNLFKN